MPTKTLATVNLNLASVGDYLSVDPILLVDLDVDVKSSLLVYAVDRQ